MKCHLKSVTTGEATLNLNNTQKQSWSDTVFPGLRVTGFVHYVAEFSALLCKMPKVSFCAPH